MGHPLIRRMASGHEREEAENGTKTARLRGGTARHEKNILGSFDNRTTTCRLCLCGVKPAEKGQAMSAEQKHLLAEAGLDLVGVGVEKWTPGDGTSRYRLFVESPTGQGRFWQTVEYMSLAEFRCYLRGMRDVQRVKDATFRMVKADQTAEAARKGITLFSDGGSSNGGAS